MAIIQISKIQQRSGNLVDLPQLDEAQFGWATDAKRLFIGKTTPNENIEVLTSYSNISFSQIDGSDGGNFNINTATNGQLLTYVSTTNTWENWPSTDILTANTNFKLDLGDVGNIKMDGGATGYILETDGAGNVAWTSKGTLRTSIVALSNATPVIMKVANTTPYTNGLAVTISGAVAANADTIINGRTFYVQVATNFPTTGNVSLYTTQDLNPSNAVVGTTLGTYTANSGISTALISGGGVSNAGGSINTIQFNNSGILNGSANFTITSGNLVTLQGNFVAGNINGGNLVNANFITGVLTTAAQPNITSTGTLTTLSVSGNANIGNIGTGGLITATGNITGANLVTGGLITATGNITGANLITGGVLSVTGNANIGNIGTGGLITATGTITGANITGANLITGGLITATGNIDGGNLRTGGRLNVTGNANVGNLGTVVVTATGNIDGGNINTANIVTASRLISNVAIGTAPLTVTSTTRVSNLNVAYANVADFISVADVTTGTFYPILANAATGNVSEGSNANLTFNAATGALNATLLGGTLTTAAQPNVTSLGTLSSLAVTGTVTAGNIQKGGTAGDTLNIYGAGNTNVNGAGGIIQIFSGDGNGTGAGGALSLNAGTANVSGNAAGGQVQIVAGDGYGQGQGGQALITAGDSGNTYGGFGATITVTGGTYDGKGGNAVVEGGSAYGENHVGGNVFIIAGPSSGNAAVGKIIFQTSTPGSTGNTVQTLSDRVIIDDTQMNVRFTTASSSTTTGALEVAGGVGVGGNVYASAFYGAATGLTSIPGANVSGTVANATHASTANTVVDAAQGNITSVGTLTGLSVSGNANTGNIGTSTAIITTGNITTINSGLLQNGTSNITITNNGNISITAAGGTTELVVTSTGANIAGTLSVSGNANIGNIGTAGLITATGNITGGNIAGTLLTGTLSTAAQPNITSVSTSFTNLTFANAQTIRGNNITLTTGSTSNLGTITGNWSLSAGSRLQATYADLAEYYEADAQYQPGTVLAFGGEKEVTIAEDGTNKVAGVVSTNPAYAMNANCQGVAVAIALQGRVPTKVRGTIHKGDMLVSGGDGYARPANNPGMGTVIGKSLENFTGEGTIEVAVGRL